MSPPSRPKSTDSGSRAASRTNPWTLRSRAGCDTCNNRRVKCDEARPICGHCTRLGLECAYKMHAQGKSRARASSSQSRSDTTLGGNFANTSDRQPPTSSTFDIGKPSSSRFPSLQSASQFPEQDTSRIQNETRLDDNWNSASLNFELQPDTHFDPPADARILSDLFRPGYHVPGMSPLWEGYSFNPTSMERLPDSIAPVSSLNSDSCNNPQWSSGTAFRTDLLDLELLLGYSNKNQQVPADSEIAPENGGQDATAVSTGRSSPPLLQDTKTVYLLSLFQRVVQPLAAILIGGVRKWRRL
jgi:hypothetical protein